MKLPEFVDYLLDADKLALFYRQQGFSPAAVEQGITIYMLGSIIKLDADIRLLTSEETGWRSKVRLDGVDYISVLEVDLAIDLITGFEAGVVTKLDKANRIVHYALYDA